MTRSLLFKTTTVFHLVNHLIFISLIFIQSCSSYEKFKRQGDDFQIPTEILNTSKEKVWASVVAVLRKFEIEQQNQDAGVIKTKWMDNTLDLNFTDSFGSNDKIKSAKFKLIVSVENIGTKKNKASKITIYKRQLVENDTFQGWREVENDYILEKTLLYRIKRVIGIDAQIEGLQKKVEKNKIEEFKDQVPQNTTNQNTNNSEAVEEDEEVVESETTSNNTNNNGKANPSTENPQSTVTTPSPSSTNDEEI